MGRLICLFMCCVFSQNVFSEELSIETNLTKPEVDLVKNIHDFCVELHSDKEVTDIEMYLLNCVNAELDMSMYQTFTNYNALRFFITTTGE